MPVTRLTVIFMGVIALLVCPFFVYAENDYEPLFLDAYLDRHDLHASLEALTTDFSLFYLSVDELATCLDLPLTINPENSRLSGWFINEKNSVQIDIPSRQYTIGEKSGQLKKEDFLVANDTLYINQRALVRLFALHSEIRSNDLKISFSSEQKLPSQEKLQRQQQQKMLQLQNGHQKEADLVDDRYHWLSSPNIDISAQLNNKRYNHRQQNNHSFTVNGSADMAKHASDFYFNSNQQQQQFRLKLSRALQLHNRSWYYEFGDANGLANNLSGGGGLGRGFSFSQSAQSNQKFSTHRFMGNAQPGWEAELYRNGALIAYQEINAEGYYLFDNIAVLMGQNNFKIVLYGPQGERKEIEENFIGHQLSQTAGQWTPEFSLIEPYKRLLALDYREKKGRNINTALTYGLSDQLQTTFGWNEKQGRSPADKRRYLSNELQGSWENAAFNLASAYETGKHTLSYRAELLSQLWKHDFTINYQSNRDSQAVPSQNLNFTLMGSQPLISSQDNYSFSFSNTQQRGDNSFDLSAQHSANYQQFSINNQMNFSHGWLNEFTGNSGGNFRLGHNMFIVDGQYEIAPSAQLRSLSATYSRSMGKAYLQLRSTLDRLLSRNDFSAQLSWNFKRFRLGTLLKVDDQQNYDISLTFSTGIGVSANDLYFSQHALKNTGTVKAISFKDDNYNGVFDKDEQPLSGVEFAGNSAWKNKKTNAEGVVYLPEVSTSGKQKVEFLSDSLDDPFLVVDKPYKQVQAHAGGVSELYFPVYQTTEIEGEIMVKRPDSEPQTQQAVPLLLIDEKGQEKGRVLSEFDGFFVFEGVIPGNYRIVVEQNYLTRKGVSFDKPISVNMSANSDNSEDIEVGTLYINAIELGNK